MKVAIVGNRRRMDLEAVEGCVGELPFGAVVISGGAKGPDSWAVEAASGRGLAVQVQRPQLGNVTIGRVRNYGEAARRYHERNQRIV